MAWCTLTRTTCPEESMYCKQVADWRQNWRLGRRGCYASHRRVFLKSNDLNDISNTGDRDLKVKRDSWTRWKCRTEVYRPRRQQWLFSSAVPDRLLVQTSQATRQPLQRSHGRQPPCLRPRSQLVDGMAEAEPGTTEEVAEVGEEPVEVAETRISLTNVGGSVFRAHRLPYLFNLFILRLKILLPSQVWNLRSIWARRPHWDRGSLPRQELHQQHPAPWRLCQDRSGGDMACFPKNDSILGNFFFRNSLCFSPLACPYVWTLSVRLLKC